MKLILDLAATVALLLIMFANLFLWAVILGG
jgi:hypothetical protein